MSMVRLGAGAYVQLLDPWCSLRQYRYRDIAFALPVNDINIAPFQCSCLPVVAGIVCNPAFSNKEPVGLHYCLLNCLGKNTHQRGIAFNPEQNICDWAPSSPPLMTASSLYLHVSGTSSDMSTNSNSSILFTSFSGRESS